MQLRNYYNLKLIVIICLISIFTSVILLIALRIFNLNPYSFYILIPLLLIGFILLIASFYLRYRNYLNVISIEKRKSPPSINQEVISPFSKINLYNIKSRDFKFNKIYKIDLQEINRIISNWVKNILIYYKRYYISAKLIYSDFKFINYPFIRIDLFWDYISNNLFIYCEKKLVSKKSLSGVYLNDSETDFLDPKMGILPISFQINLKNFPFSSNDLKKKLRFSYPSKNQAKVLIEYDLKFFAKKKGISSDLILKKFWIHLQDLNV